MSGGAEGLKILLKERPVKAPSAPADLVEAVFKIEERVQFDEKRNEAPGKIAAVVRALLDGESHGQGNDGHAS